MTVTGAEECRVRARICRDQAARAVDPMNRLHLGDLAEHWEAMARDIENIARMRKAMADEERWGRV